MNPYKRYRQQQVSWAARYAVYMGWDLTAYVYARMAARAAVRPTVWRVRPVSTA